MLLASRRRGGWLITGSDSPRWPRRGATESIGAIGSRFEPPCPHIQVVLRKVAGQKEVSIDNPAKDISETVLSIPFLGGLFAIRIVRREPVQKYTYNMMMRRSIVVVRDLKGICYDYSYF